VSDTTLGFQPGWHAFAGTSPGVRLGVKRRARRLVYGFLNAFKNRYAEVEDKPVIVLGNQKSGTSAIAHLLADCGGVSKTIDIPPLWPPVGIEIMRRETDFASVVRHHRAQFSTKVIKEPMMTFFVDQVLGVFPEGTYLFVVRDPRDNIRSLLNRRQIPGDLAEIEPDLVPALPPHNVVVDPAVWGGVGENYVGVLAHRWNRAVDSYLRHADRFHLAKYEDFGQDKVGFIEDLAGQVGIAPAKDVSDRVDTQFQPPGEHDTPWEQFFGRENLAHIERICRGRMAILGYAPPPIGGAV